MPSKLDLLLEQVRETSLPLYLSLYLPGLGIGSCGRIITIPPLPVAPLLPRFLAPWARIACLRLTLPQYDHMGSIVRM